MRFMIGLKRRKKTPDPVSFPQLGKSFSKWLAGRDEGPKRMNLITDQAIWFLNEQAQGNRPFFLHVSHHAVHIPNQATPATAWNNVPRSPISVPGRCHDSGPRK